MEAITKNWLPDTMIADMVQAALKTGIIKKSDPPQKTNRWVRFK